MEMIPDPRTSPAELTVDTVRAWLLELNAGGATDWCTVYALGCPAACRGVSARLAQPGGAEKRLATGRSQRRCIRRMECSIC